MIKICDMKFEIDDWEITIDDAITIQVIKVSDYSFEKFLNILRHETRKKEKPPTLECLAEFLEDEKLQIKNQDKATKNYKKQFINKKEKPSTWSKDSNDSTKASILNCKFCEKRHRPNGCRHLQTKCHHYHKIVHIAKFCKKEASFEASSRLIIKFTKGISCFLILHWPKTIISCNVNTKFPKSSIKKTILDFKATDHSFSNRSFCSIYEKYHFTFQGGSTKPLAAYRYDDFILCLAYPDGSKII